MVLINIKHSGQPVCWGQNYNSPREAWDKMLESGKISQEQYNKYINMI